MIIFLAKLDDVIKWYFLWEVVRPTLQSRYILRACEPSKVDTSPVCFSADLSVYAWRRAMSLRPFLFAAYNPILKLSPDSKPPTVKIGIREVTLLTNFPDCVSYTSITNSWGNPPSKPSMHSTFSDSAVWFKIVQFWSGSGLPKVKIIVINYGFKLNPKASKLPIY